MSETETGSSNFRVEGALFIVAFIVAVVILLTDMNLQTDFGIHARYFIHWYGMLVIAIVALIAGIILLTTKKRSLGLAGTIGSALIAMFLVGDLATYSQVGFTSVAQFATYLFGITKYPGTLSYMPGMYDLLLILFILAAIAGAISLRRKKESQTS
jgi:hypothetical protein